MAGWERPANSRVTFPKNNVEISVAEDVERMTVTHTNGAPDRSGLYTVLGIILGALIIGGVALAIIGVPKIEAWWGNDSTGSSSHSTTVVTPGGSSTTTSNSN